MQPRGGGTGLLPNFPWCLGHASKPRHGRAVNTPRELLKHAGLVRHTTRRVRELS